MLAGFPDDRADEGPAAGPATLVGLELARANGWTAPRQNREDTQKQAPADGRREHVRDATATGGGPGVARPSAPSPRPSSTRTPSPATTAAASTATDRTREGQAPAMTDTLTPVLSDNWDQDRAWTLAAYEERGGYGALDKALGMDQDAVITQVKDSGLRGRGGAGFPTGMKWGFIPQGDGKPHYLVVNADESEPGTCKDIPLMMASPHTLIEGVIISSYAIRANVAFIYVRGEVLHVVRRLQRAVQEAYLAGHLGQGHPRLRLRPRADRACRGRRLHLR